MMRREPSQIRVRERVDQEDTATLLYSSVTTGASKGVVSSYKNLIAMVQMVVNRFKLEEGKEIFICTMPTFHIYGLVAFAISLRLPPPNWPIRQRRRPDLTLPMPQRDTSLAVPLPLPPSSSNLQLEHSELERVSRIGSGAGGTVYKSPDGDIFDCVLTHQQPAFDHPLLQGEMPMRPKGLRTPPTTSDTFSENFQTWTLSDESCPKNSIPIRRTTEQDLLRASSIRRFGRKISSPETSLPKPSPPPRNPNLSKFPELELPDLAGECLREGRGGDAERRHELCCRGGGGERELVLELRRHDPRLRLHQMVENLHPRPVLRHQTLRRLFVVPLLSFHFISTNNPYAMNYRFIATDTLQKLIVLAVWSRISARASLDWSITLFSLSTLPNTPLRGYPLAQKHVRRRLRQPHGPDRRPPVHHLVHARSLISEQFPDTTASIISFRVDTDVISLYVREPLETQVEAPTRVPAVVVAAAGDRIDAVDQSGVAESVELLRRGLHQNRDFRIAEDGEVDGFAEEPAAALGEGDLLA
ncbi:hypothetical protein SASPL_108626 [Salvia splendens]|uniref:4-coumarate--CoA ligase n=1 Tax=Salvia splendens TaxID=180675 RepID=A0A8X9A7M4_SALSN|nr:hypothetical protein SASPL_108626 [Salvia splendens]